MRREGFELQVSKPQVILSEIDGVLSEPFEVFNVKCLRKCRAVIESLGSNEKVKC